MEKKSLGRGLEDISRTFLSTGKTPKPPQMTPGFSSVPIREESCSACLNIVTAPFALPKCRIFSFHSEKYGVSAMDSIMHDYARYCRYFEPLVPKDAGNDLTRKIKSSNEDEVPYDVEETVNSHKRIAFQNDGNAQKNLKSMLSDHLEKGYEITHIDLEKTEEHSEPGLYKKRHEEVSIFIL